MICIYNKWIPFKGFNAINILGILFVRRGGYVGTVTINHERIHTRQQVEMLFIFFYLWYFVEWVILLVRYRNWMKAYRNIRIEREAFDNERNLNYLGQRKPYAWLRMKNINNKNNN